VVEKWGSPKSVGSGMKMLFSKNSDSMLYALLAGLSFAAIAIAWVGFTYLEIILLASFLFEILINKFKGIDSTTHTMIYLVMFGFGFLVTFPVYYQMGLENMNVPVYLFLAAFVVGILFSMTRDMPWVVVMPLLGVVLAIALAIVEVVYPALGEAIFTGQGYFSASKLYETIAEAKAPIFSQLALSFGMVTFYLSLIGLVFMVWRIPKRVTGDYIIITVWLAVAIFMAASAGRFVFNASPAFAIACAWITLLIIDKLDFRKAGKQYIGSSGSKLQSFRKSIKIRHMIGALFLVFLLIMPNLWFSIDAGIPMESKSTIDKQIYDSFPDFMKPAGYKNGSTWYLGSFGYNLPMPSGYFPAFWSWFSKQDTDKLPEQARPGYVSWWDYGFESIDAGDHPAVADNFQQGYQVAGNILLTGGEGNAIGMMIARMIASSMYASEIPQEIRDILTNYGASPEIVKDVFLNYSKYKEIILERPDIYDPATLDISPVNIIWRYLGVYFANLGLENEVGIYLDLTNYLGQTIEYIGVDSRLLPKSYNDVGVFYAPAKLTDRTIDEDGNPSDYFVIRAIDTNGYDWSLTEARNNKDITINEYKLIYSWRFFKSMLYRAYAGFAPTDAGQTTNDGIPGLSGSTVNTVPLPAWNLTHFMMVYRTCYYNPEKDGSGTWQAISLEDAISLKSQIDAGTADGLVDLSPANAYYGGVVLLKYYPGALLTGRITTPGGEPAPGIRVTVQDQWGVPHQAVASDNQGIYTLILPPGQDLVTVSTGLPNTRTLVSQTTLASYEFNVSDDAAMRKNVDSNGDGLVDWRLVKNIEVPGARLTGAVFWDVDSDNNYTEGDVLIKDATLTAYNYQTGKSYPIDASTGQFSVNLTTGKYELNTVVNGIRREGEKTFLIASQADATREISRIPGKINGTVLYEDGSPAAGAYVTLYADEDGLYPGMATVITDSKGTYEFQPIYLGRYLMAASISDGQFTSFERLVELDSTTKQLQVNFTLQQAGTLNIKVIGLDDKPMAYAHIRISNAFNPAESTVALTGENGRTTITLGTGNYSLIVSEPTGTGMAVGGASVFVKNFEEKSIEIRTSPGISVSGRVTNTTGVTSNNLLQAQVTFRNGLVTYHTATTTTSGGYFVTYLPAGTYGVEITDGWSRIKTMTVTVPTQGLLDINLETNYTVSGQIWHDFNGNGTFDKTEYVSFADIAVGLPGGSTLTTQTDFYGVFSIAVPKSTVLEVSANLNGYEASEPITVSTVQNTSVRIKLDLAPVFIDGKIALGNTPIGGLFVEFLNDTRYTNFTSGTDGSFNTSIYPGIYNIRIRSQIAEGSPLYYYYDKMTAIYVGTNFHDLTIEVELRLKVEGSMVGVPATRSTMLFFDGPTQTALNVFGTYETFLKPGDYVIYAYDAQQKQMANISRYYLTSVNTNITINLVSGHEIRGEPQIGQRKGNRTQLQITDLVSGITVNETLQPGNPFSVVLPDGDYGMRFEMHFYEETASKQRYYKMVNETTVSLDARTTLNPVMIQELDNSSLIMKIVGPNGQPVSTKVLFLESNDMSIFEQYTSDVNGMIESTIHPGPYTVYFFDSLTGLSLLEQVTVGFSKATYINATATEAYRVTVYATVQNGTDINNLVLTITDLDNDGLIKNSENFGINSVTTMLPRGNYSISAQSQRLENERIISYKGTNVTKVTSNNIVMNMQLARVNTYKLTATWDSSQKASAGIGDSVVYHIDISNTGNTKDSYTLSSSDRGFMFGFPSSPTELDFGPYGNSASVPVTITVGKDALVVNNELTIVVASKGNSTVKEFVTVTIDILPFYSVNASASSGGSVNGALFYNDIRITNNGNIEDNYSLTILNSNELLANGWVAEINGNATLVWKTNEIQPGLADVINITMRAIRSLPDSNISVAILVVSNSSAASAIVYATPQLPNLEIERSGGVVGNGIYANNIFADRDSENLIIMIALLAMLAGIFIVRKIRFGRFLR
jgi:dolichyl-diphosphooligosaccharide--protein glycosyltransferase